MDHFLMYDGREAQLRTLGSDDDDEDYSESSDDDDDREMCINRNIDKYVDWLKDMYSSIDPPPKGERAPTFETPLVVIQVSPSVLPVYMPSVRIYQYEINEEDGSATAQDNSAQEQSYPESSHYENGPPKPHGTLLGYKQYFSNITEWDLRADSSLPLEYQLEYDTREAYGLGDLTADSYFQFAKDMVEGSGDSAGDSRLWSNFINNMFVQTLNDSNLSK
jgi:hypothetical protein